MRTNQYPAPCVRCGDRVPAGGGTLQRSGRGWRVAHHDCGQGASLEPASPDAADPVGEIEAGHARLERKTDSAERAKGRADHFQWELAWELDQGGAG